MKNSGKLTAVLGAVLCTASAAEQVPAWKETNFKFRFTPPPNIRQIVYDGGMKNGKPAKVFAWLGVPENCTGKVPGVVLVHGGDGTAFYHWVRKWTRRGYAAIAMDTVGCRPLKKWEGAGCRTKLEGGSQSYHDYLFDVKHPKESWTSLAVEAIRNGHTILRSLPEVDPEKTAVYGISWGGYLTCFAAKADLRFKAAVSVYGCGFLKESRRTVKEATDEWLKLFDPATVLPEVKCPMLFITRPDDHAYEWNSWKRSSVLPEKSFRSVPGCFGHCHASGLRIEGEVFIDSVLKGTPALPEIGKLKQNGKTVSATFKGGVAPFKGELWWTDSPDSVPEPKKKWQSTPAVIQNDTVSAELPDGAKDWFLNVTDKRKAAVTAIHP